MHVLAADIGGTNARFILIEIESDKQRVLSRDTYSCNDYPSLNAVLIAFLEHIYGNEIKLDAACFAVAGPVETGEAKITNLPWVVSEVELSTLLKTENISLINDFSAVSYGIGLLNDSDIAVLQTGHATSDNQYPDAAIIGAGTGLGASHRVFIDGRYKVLSSETGHCGFAPANELQIDLLRWMQKTHDYVSLEMLLSGNGLYFIYQFMVQYMDVSEAENIQNEFSEHDPASVIAKYADDFNDPICHACIDCFIDIYGTAAANVVLHYYPVHELYVAGGIAPKLLQRMQDGRFIKAFNINGPMSSVLEKITIKLIMQTDVGLLGALYIAKESCFYKI